MVDTPEENAPQAVTVARSPYSFDELQEETFPLTRRDGSVIATITCHEATGKESAVLSVLSALEGSACDAYMQSLGAKLEKAKGGKEIWQMPEGSALSLDDRNFLTFRRRVYPKLAACSTCDLERLPTAEEAWCFPESELDKWYRAALKVNPVWFDEFRQQPRQEVLNELAKGKPSAALKKGSRKRHRSSAS